MYAENINDCLQFINVNMRHRENTTTNAHLHSPFTQELSSRKCTRNEDASYMYLAMSSVGLITSTHLSQRDRGGYNYKGWLSCVLSVHYYSHILHHVQYASQRRIIFIHVCQIIGNGVIIKDLIVIKVVAAVFLWQRLSLQGQLHFNVAWGTELQQFLYFSDCT